MAKTLFSDGNPLQGILGTIVNAAFLNKIFSHRHDGLDQDGSAPLDYAADTGSANTYAIALAPAITAHIAGLPIHFKAINANTGASTLAVNGLAAVAIKQVDGSDLPGGAIVAGQMITVMYTGTFYALMSSTITPSMFMRALLDDTSAAEARVTLGITTNSAATENIAGLVELATPAENAAGTIENKAVDPLGIREAFNATGSAPVYACRAWVNFNGTGTVAIRASGNVSSITDNGVGDYTVNFTTVMPDVNYAVVGTCTLQANSPIMTINSQTTQYVGSVRVLTRTSDANNAQDNTGNNVAIFR